MHQQLGGHFRLFLSSGAFLPPALQQAWEDLGVTVLQGYGATETGTGTCTTLDDHGPGTVGRPPEGIEMRLAPDGEIQFRGRTVFSGYWQHPEATAEAFTEDGWYRTGDIGHLDDGGRLILSGRTKDIIVLPNGFNVYPEDIENALRVAGIRDSVVVETLPGRIEAVVLAGPGEPDPAELRRAHRCRRQGGERHARAEPAHRRLAPLARGGLPPHAHPQDQARAGAHLGGGRHAAPRGRRSGAAPVDDRFAQIPRARRADLALAVEHVPAQRVAQPLVVEHQSSDLVGGAGSAATGAPDGQRRRVRPRRPPPVRP